MGTGFLRVSGWIVKLPTLAFSVMVKNEWSCVSIPLICLHGVNGEDAAFYRFKNKYNWCRLRTRKMGRS
jgi:hypothetical protein